MEQKLGLAKAATRRFAQERSTKVLTRGRIWIAGILGGLALLALAIGPGSVGTLFAQTPSPAPGGTITVEQMYEMMDAMHGAGTSQRMREAMGPNADELMAQCATAMGTMATMHGTMHGMMGGQTGLSMQGMMSQHMR